MTDLQTTTERYKIDDLFKIVIDYLMDKDGSLPIPAMAALVKLRNMLVDKSDSN